jgi:two-component system, OmpR family, response regulator MprA
MLDNIQEKQFTGESMKILTIDDDPAMTDLLKLVLAPMKAYVITANSGEEGLRLLVEKNPDIVLLDLMMPEIDGWQVTHEIRKSSLVPILILSVIDNPAMVARALDAGADDYLIKPAPGNVLIPHINNPTRRRQRTLHDSPNLQVDLPSAF